MRLDLFLTKNGIFESRSRASAAIADGRIAVFGKKVDKASFDVDETKTTREDITIEYDPVDEMVGRAGLKLAHALDFFRINVDGLRAIDIGASTGGFTQCLVERGAKKVYAVDVGKDQLHKSLREDTRVVSIEGFNARELELETVDNECVGIAVMDVSFISQTLLYDAVKRVLKKGGVFVSLIKPQFELSKSDLGKNGIVKTLKLRDKACDRVIAAAENSGFSLLGKTESPILGGSGNTEYLACFVLKDD